MTAAARDLWRRVSRALATLVRPGSVSSPDEDDLEAELEAHIGFLADDHARTGMTAREASRRAHLEVGGITQIREMARDRCSSTWLDGCRRDLHFASRSLRATPTFTLVAVLSIALSMGASTAIFSVLNGLALKPLPVEQPEQLVRLSNARSPLSRGVYNYAILDQIRQLSAGFEGALAFACCVRGQVTTAHTEETVDEMLVSGDFFATLGVRPHLGRLLSVEDDSVIGGAAGPTAVISYALWQRLGHPADIVGRSMAMGRVPVTVVGVTPPKFFGPEVGRRFDVALPIRAQRVLDPANPLGDDILHLQIWLRLRHDTPLSTAVAALRAAQPRIRQATMPGPALPGNFVGPFHPCARRGRHLGATRSVRASPLGTDGSRGAGATDHVRQSGEPLVGARPRSGA